MWQRRALCGSPGGVGAAPGRPALAVLAINVVGSFALGVTGPGFCAPRIPMPLTGGGGEQTQNAERTPL